MRSSLKIKKDYIYFFFIGLGLILIAGLRPIGIDRDSLAYISHLNIHIENANLIDKEPSFWIINELNNFLFNGYHQTFFLLFAIIGISLKLLSIKKLSLFPILSIYIYICLYFVLHEMTQIRVGVASAIFLLAINDILNKNFKNYFFKTLLAIMFHYSSVIMLLVYFLHPKKINFKLYMALPIVGFFFVFFNKYTIDIIELFSFILPKFLSSKINLYIALLEDNNIINIFNYYYLFLLILYYILLFNFEKLKSIYDILFLKILGIMLFVFYSLSVFPVLAFRVSEFFGVVLIVLIPHFVIIFKNKKIVTLLIILLISIYFVAIMIMRNIII